jgi:flagellar biosynthesis/type III secretory pathway protein FliH
MSITTSMEVMIQNHFNKFFEELKFQGIDLNRDLIKDIEDLEYNCIEVTKSQNSTEQEEWHDKGFDTGLDTGKEIGYCKGYDEGYQAGLELEECKCTQ